MIRYIYAKGPLLDKPNTYFYTPYHGAGFIKAWKADRSRVSKTLGKPMRLPHGKIKDAEISLKRVLQRFEVTKRVYSANGYKDAGLYLEAAGLFESMYEKHKKLTYLNALLKIIDTLCSVKDTLNKRQRQNLAWLILREFKHVKALARTAGVFI